MQRVGHHFTQAAVSFNSSRHVKGLHGNLDLVEILLLQQADLPQGGGHHVVHYAVVARLRFAGLGQTVHQVHVAGEAAGASDTAHWREAAEIDADADGDVALLGRLHHLAHLVFVAQVARIESQAVHAAGGALQGQLVVEVDVGDERNVNLLFDLRHRLGGLHIGHRRADNLATRLFQLVDLSHRRLHVAGVGFSHRLDGHIGVAAHLHAAHVHRFGNSPFRHGHHQHRRCLRVIGGVGCWASGTDAAMIHDYAIRLLLRGIGAGNSV